MRLLLLLSALLIFSIGLVMVFNTSSAEVLDRALDKNVHHALYRQISYAAIGLLLAPLVWKVGYENWIRMSPFLLVLGVIMLLLVFVPGIGGARNGAHRWIAVGGFTFQPSEFVKILVPLVYINAFLRHKGEIGFLRFLKIALPLSIPMFLVMIEPDNGTAAVIGASLLPLFFVSKIKLRFWALPVLLLMCVGVIAAINLPYVRGRLQVYIHPELDLQGKGHQPYQAKIAAGSGGLLGRGPGGSLQKLTYLPEAQNDYIAAIYAEEFGFAGILALILLYMLFATAGFTLALQAKTESGALLAMITTYLITLQAFLNLGVVSGLLPSKGVNLPFFSQGGTSLIANSIALTLLLNIQTLKSTLKLTKNPS